MYVEMYAPPNVYTTETISTARMLEILHQHK